TVDQEVVLIISQRPPVGEELAFLLGSHGPHADRTAAISDSHLAVGNFSAGIPGYVHDQGVGVVDGYPHVARAGEKCVEGHHDMIDPVIDEAWIRLTLGGTHGSPGRI